MIVSRRMTFSNAKSPRVSLVERASLSLVQSRGECANTHPAVMTTREAGSCLCCRRCLAHESDRYDRE